MIRLLAAALLVSAPAFSMDGYELFDRCTAGPDPVCQGYVVGVLDSVEMTRWARVCLPAEATLEEAQIELSGYLRNHLSVLSNPGPKLVVEAMHASWPCVSTP